MDRLLAERFGQRFGRAASVLQRRCKVNLDVTVAGNGVVLGVDLIELPHALRDNADFHAVARADGKGLLDGIEFAELRELVEHEQETLLFRLRVLLFCFSL